MTRLLTAEETSEQLAWVYGPFQPGSVARAQRAENAARGLRTCWQCLDGYRPRSEWSNGKHHVWGRGKRFCSLACYYAWLAEHPGQRPQPRRLPPPSHAEVRAEMEAALRAFDAALGA